MPVQRAIELAEQAGFRFNKPLAGKPEDDQRSILTKTARHTDRFLLKLTKPTRLTLQFCTDQVNLLLSGGHQDNSPKRILRHYEATKTRSGYSR